MTTTTTPQPRRTGWRLAGYLVRRATMLEVHGYQSIYRFLFRRPKVPPGATGFSYHRSVLEILIVFVVVSAVELVVVDVVVQRWWPQMRIPLLVLGCWGLILMFGLLFGMLTRPHAIGPQGIRVRSGAEIEIPLSWNDIYSVTRRKDMVEGKQPRVTVDDNGDATLHMRMQNETNIEVKLERPMSFRLPHGIETVGQVNLYADDAKGFMEAVRQHRPAAAPM